MFKYYDFKEGTNITTLELFKADGTSLGELKHAYNRVSKLTLGAVSELSFNLPNVATVFNILLNEDGTLDVPDSSNDDIGKTSITLAGYEVKATYSNGLEIFFLLPNKTIESDMLKTDVSFTCYSREYELSRKLLLDYRGVLIDNKYVLDGLSLEEVVRDILGGTFWDIEFLDEGYNNADSNCMRRTVEAFNGVSKLAAIDTICNIFGAIPEYDTVNRRVYFYRADNEERYKYNGLNIDGNNYLKNARQSEDLTQIVTRLYGTGANNLTINGVNPTGVSYIEDLSYFIFPAKLNESKTGLAKSSKFMSDELSLAELLYEDKIVNINDRFKILYNEQDEYQKEKITLENELTNLQTELNIINDNIDVMYIGMNKATEDNTEYVAKRTEKENKEKEIAAKNKEIENKQKQIDDVNQQLADLYDSLKVENNFSEKLLKERESYIYEGTYTNTGISIEQDLYEEMIEYLQSKNEPSVVVEIELNSMFSMKSKTAQIDKQKVVLGEKIDVYYKFRGVDIDIQAQILELIIDEEQNTLEITIANTRDYKKDASDYLENILQRSITTSTMVDNNVIDWNKGKIALDDIDDLYEQGISAAKIQIEGAADNSVTFNERGITITNTTEPLRFLRATNGVLALTKDGGRTYSTAITPEGVWAERLIGEMFVGNNLSIFGGDGNELSISNIPSGTYQDKTLEDTWYGDDFGIVLKSNLNTIYMTKERGFKIVNKDNKNLFIADKNGNMYLNGTIVSNSATITGGSLTIGNNFSVTNNGILSASGVNVTGTINATTLTTSNGTIGNFKIDQWNLIGGSGSSQVGMCSTSGKNYAFWAGSSDSSSAPFRVGHNGSLWCNNAYIEGEIQATSGRFQNCTVTGSCNIECSVPGGLVTSGVNAGNITAGSMSGDRVRAGTIEGTNLRISNAVGFFKMEYSSTMHFWASAGNFANGIGNGINFYSGAGIDSVGSWLGRISQSDGAMYIQSSGTVNINHNSSGQVNGDVGICDMHFHANHLYGSGGASVWANQNCGFDPASGGNAYVGDVAPANLIQTGMGGLSSINVKTNLQEIKTSDFYKDLQKWKFYDFDYKYSGLDEDKHSFGFIIEQVEELDTIKNYAKHYDVDMYKKGKHLDKFKDDNAEVFKTKGWNRDSYLKLSLILIKSLQEKIDELERKMEEK